MSSVSNTVCMNATGLQPVFSHKSDLYQKCWRP